MKTKKKKLGESFPCAKCGELAVRKMARQKYCRNCSYRSRPFLHLPAMPDDVSRAEKLLDEGDSEAEAIFDEWIRQVTEKCNRQPKDSGEHRKPRTGEKSHDTAEEKYEAIRTIPTFTRGHCITFVRPGRTF